MKNNKRSAVALWRKVLGGILKQTMNTCNRMPIFFYAVLLSLIINGNLYSSDVGSPGLRCEVNNKWNKWDADKKNKIKQTIGLKEAKYIFLTPEKAIYNKETTYKNMHSCVYQNKMLSVTVNEHDDVSGTIYVEPHFLHANANSREKESNDILAAASYEYGMYTKIYSINYYPSLGDIEDINTPLGSLFTATFYMPLSLRLLPKFFYIPGAIRHKRSYYFVVIVRTPNQNSEVYAMIVGPK